MSKESIKEAVNNLLESLNDEELRRVYYLLQGILGRAVS